MFLLASEILSELEISSRCGVDFDQILGVNGCDRIQVRQVTLLRFDDIANSRARGS